MAPREAEAEYRGPRRRRGEPDYAGPPNDEADEPEYRGPRRRKEDREHEDGVQITGPPWIGSASFTGAYTIPALALLIVAASAGVSTYYGHKANMVQTDVIEANRLMAQRDHQRIMLEIEEQTEIGRQTLCMIAIVEPKDRVAALRHGDVCHWLGVRATSRRLPEEFRDHRRDGS